MAKKSKSKHLPSFNRTNVLIDKWSLVHFSTGVFLGWIMSPIIALLLMVLWEPFEIFIISPIVVRRGIDFGYETLRNSLSDIVVDSAGIITGAVLLSNYFTPPFHLF